MLFQMVSHMTKFNASCRKKLTFKLSKKKKHPGLNMGNGYGIRNIEDCINYCKEKSYPYAGLQYALESKFFCSCIFKPHLIPHGE